jgi:hypothetical protein
VSVYRTATQFSQAIAALAGAAPALCETFTLAQPSVEGAVISGLHIHAGDAKGNRNGVLLLGGVHARGREPGSQDPRGAAQILACPQRSTRSAA